MSGQYEPGLLEMNTKRILVLEKCIRFATLIYLTLGCPQIYIYVFQYYEQQDMVHIYAIENTIFLISDTIIKYGTVKVLEKGKKLIDEFEVINTNYRRHSVSAPKGKYLVKFIDSDEKTEKFVFLQNMGSTNNNINKL